MPTVACPACQRKLRIPDDLPGRKVTCPRCHQTVPVRHSSQPLAEEDAPSTEPPLSEAPEPLRPSARLGMIAMVLGVFSIPVLCIPFVGYAAILLSGVGLFLAVRGLLIAQPSGTREVSSSPAEGAAKSPRFGERDRDYPLAGIAACVLALILALLPFLFR